MSLKLFGAVCIIAGCSGVGFSIAAAHRKEEDALQQLIQAVECMACELQYRMTALPEVCMCAADGTKGTVHEVFQNLAGQLQLQSEPEVSICMASAVAAVPKLPEAAKRNLLQLGLSMGRYDLSGQLSGLEAVRELASRDLRGLQSNRDVRLRNYQTLGICAGVALAILFI